MKKNKDILIIDPVHPVLIEQLAETGWNCFYFPDIEKEEVKEKISGMTGLVVRTKMQIDKEIMEAGKKLQFIARAGAGMDNIDVDFAVSKNIQLLNAPEGNADAVGEHVVGMILSLLRKINSSSYEVKNKIWLREENRGLELNGKTFAIIGYGNMGKSTAQKLKGFGLRIIAYDKYLKNFGNESVEEVPLETIYETADLVSLHLPLTDETNYLVNHDFIAHFKRPFFLINTSRGKILKTVDVLRELESGKIKGLCLDVLENEKLQTLFGEDKMIFEKLTNNPHVIITPHIGGWTMESYYKISRVLAQKIKALSIENE